MTRIEGFETGDLSSVVGDTPLYTGLNRAFATLSYGSYRPNLILSSNAIKNEALRRIIPSQVVPMVYHNRLGFDFNGAAWIDDDQLEGTRTIAILNEKYPDDPKFNGQYEYPLTGENNERS